MNPDGPYVSVAAFCDSVLHEKDERISCIRFLDTMNVALPEDAPPEAAVSFVGTVLVSLKSGRFQGTKILTITLKHPLGKIGKKPTASLPVVFKGNEHGANVIMRLEIQVDTDGLYYFDVELEGELMTRMPLRVNLTRMKPAEIHQH